MRKITLTKGRHALVDDADYDWLMKWKWRATSKRMRKDGTQDFYAVREGRIDDGPMRGKEIQMHREILGLPRGQKQPEGEHKDHNGLNNQRSNLREASRSLNARNSHRSWSNTGARGVSYAPKTNKPRPFEAYAQDLSRRKHHIGWFATLEEAKAARDIYLEHIGVQDFSPR